MKYTKRRKAIMAALLAVMMVVSSLVPSMGAMAAEPNYANSETEAKAPSLRILFSAEYYAQNNPDVYAAFGDDANLLYQHYVNYGIPEGRRYLTPILDVRAYRAGNPDLERAFGNNYEKYVWHFLNYGAQEIAEGLRAPKGLIFDAVKYLDAHPDVRRVVGNDLLAAMQHYVSSGLPVGNWVSVKYTAGPAVVSQTSSTSNVSTSSNNGNNSNSNNSSSNGDGSGGNSNSGNNGGGSGKPNPTPDKPGTKPPVIDPEQPDKPDEPVQPTHSKDSLHVKEDFGEDGKCTQGCGLTLAEFQQACKMDHSTIEIGHYCLVCGAEGTYDSSEEHTKDSLHTKNSFGDDGLCLRGCGLTLAEFQQNCTENHELHVGQVCPNCNYQGTMLYDKDECPKKDSHEYGKECDFCNYAGECLEDHGQIYTTKLCPVCGEYGAKVCEVDHTELFVGTFCDECGIEGTKEKPEVCENEANHGALHKGQSCPSCGYAGEAGHTWDKATGECTGCDEKCPNIDSHADILQGETCEICGYEGMKEPTLVHPDGYMHSLADFVGGKCGICGMTVDDFQRDCTSDEHETLKATGGICSVCGKQIEKEEEPFVCPNADAHEELHEGVACGIEGCDYVGKASHTFEGGECTGCDATCTPETCPDKENHEENAGYTCLTCGYSVPEEPEPLHPEGYTHQPTDYTDGICRVCGAKCLNWDNHKTLTCGAKCLDCDYVDPVGHQYDEHGVCTRCGDRCTVDTCPNKEGHNALPCGGTCEVCGSAMLDHNYVEDGGAWICTRCHEECSHAFYHGKCSHCGATCDENTCPNGESHSNLANGEVCDTCGHVAVVTPVEHIHDWSAQNGTCAGEGECPGCPNAGSHGDIPATATCDTCGAAGTKPVYAYTPNDGKHTCDYVDNVCTLCGGQTVGFGEGEEEIDIGTGDITSGETGWDDDEDHSISGEAGGSGAGGNSGDEDGTDVPSDNTLPDALPVDVVVVTEQKDKIEPEPEDDGEDEDNVEGGGTPADGDDEEGNDDGENSEGSSEQSS